MEAMIHNHEGRGSIPRLATKGKQKSYPFILWWFQGINEILH